MDLVKIISELRKERAAVDDALVYLEQLARTQGKRRGRPPAYLAGRGMEATVTPSKRKPMSEATKKKMAAAQKRRWAEYRKKHAAGQ